MTKNKEIVNQFFIQAYNKKNYDFIKNNLTENYIDNSPAQARGPEECIGILKQVHTAFPDIQVELINLIEENNIVVHFGKFKATHEGDYIGNKASGKTIEWEAMEIFKVVNEKIVESWGYWPDYGMIEQMKK